MIHPALVKGRVSARGRDLDSEPDELWGVAGTLARTFGHPDHAANEVLLDDVGLTQLFWHRQLRDEPPGEWRPSTMHRRAYLRRASTCAAP